MRFSLEGGNLKKQKKGMEGLGTAPWEREEKELRASQHCLQNGQADCSVLSSQGGTLTLLVCDNFSLECCGRSGLDSGSPFS